MTDAERISRLIGVVLTRVEVSACAYLEQRGLKYCLHFGFMNCVQMAANQYTSKLELAMKRTAKS